MIPREASDIFMKKDRRREVVFSSVEIEQSKQTGRNVRLFMHEPMESELRQMLEQQAKDGDKDLEDKKILFQLKLKYEKQRIL